MYHLIRYIDSHCEFVCIFKQISKVDVEGMIDENYPIVRGEIVEVLFEKGNTPLWVKQQSPRDSHSGFYKDRVRFSNVSLDRVKDEYYMEML